MKKEVMKPKFTKPKVVKLKGIKKQVVTKSFILMIASVIAVVTSTAVIGKYTLLNSSSDLLSSFAKQVGQDIGRVIELEIDKVEVIAESALLRSSDVNLETKLGYLSEIVKKQGYKKAAIIDLNGQCKTILGETVDVSDKKYFKENLAGKSYFSAPTLSKADGGLQISVTTPIYNYKGEMISVLFFSKDAEDISRITNDIKFAATGTAYVVDENGTNIMNNDIEKVKNEVNRIEDAKTDSSYKELADITKKMIAGEIGTGSYKIDGKTKFLGYAPVENTGWSVGITCNLKDMLSQMNKLMGSLIVVGIIALIVMLISSYRIAEKLSVRLIKLKDEVEEISTGNFEAKEVNETKNDEITAIYESLENTKKSVGYMINVIKESANELNNESNQLKSVSEVFLEGTSNINDSVEQATKATESQASELSEINIILNDFDAKMNESNKNVESINKKSEDISNKANSSCKDMEELSKFMEVLNDSFSSFAKEIIEMKEQMETINDITKLISDISDQTNLLALNAAIEAARAGEAGKGFSVVADEIGTLAEQSKESTANINEVIYKVIDKAKNIAETSEEITSQLVSGEKNVENSIISFEGILNNVEEVTKMIKVVSNNFTTVIKQKDEIVEKVEQASSVSEEMVATSEEISAATNAFVMSSSDIKDSTDSLSELTSNMEKAVNQFKI